MNRTLCLCCSTLTLLAGCAGGDGSRDDAVGSEMDCVPGGDTSCGAPAMTGGTDGADTAAMDPEAPVNPPPAIGDAMNDDGVMSADDPNEPDETDPMEPPGMGEDDPVVEPDAPVMEEPTMEPPLEEEPTSEPPLEDPMEGEPTDEEMPDGGGEDPELVTGEVPDIEYCADVFAWEASWSQWEDEVLLLVNEERARGADCGAQGSFEPAEPLSMDPLLRCTARAHSLDMFERGFFDHTNPDGDGPGERLDAADYMGSTWGENIAQGYPSPEEVVQGWMDSDGHCSNIMAPQFSLIGVGYYAGEAGERFSRNAHYWTQNFGAPPRDFGGGRGR